MEEQGIVFVVDDDAEVRQSWECVLAAAELPTRSFATAEAFLAEAPCDQPSCLVLDLRMPGMGGQALLETLRRRHPDLPVIIISGHADVPAVIQAMRLGVVDFLTKPVDPAKLLDKIRAALRDVIAGRSRKSDEVSIKARLATLTDRELDVFRLLVCGKLHKQIARELGISTRTVDHHHAQISRKTHAESLSELVRIGFVAGIT
jgi:two-component system, LuxR family, response regulator FixJ